MVRILKEVCGSARYLLQNIMANKLKAPSGLSRGRVIRIDCFQKKSNTFLIRNIKFYMRFSSCIIEQPFVIWLNLINIPINFNRFIHLSTGQISKILDIRSGRFVATNGFHGRWSDSRSMQRQMCINDGLCLHHL